MFASGVHAPGKGNMKVRINFTLEIDQQQWADIFYLSPNEVREDVHEYVRNIVLMQLQEIGANAQAVAQ
jgi:hypothetical protein